MKTAKTSLSISGFNAVAESDAGFEFELKQTDNLTGTGVFLTVVGAHASEVTAWTNKHVNGLILERTMAERKGKTVEPKSLEDTVKKNLQGTVLRVTGWRGVVEEFDRALLLTVLEKNPHFAEQIIEQSNNMANFTSAR